MHVPEDRLAKLQRFREAGADPYPAGTSLPGREPIAAALQRCDPDKEPLAVVTVAGRVCALRDHGNSLFADVRDGSGRLQVYLRRKALAEEVFQLFKDGLDLGDFLAVRGELGRTRMGEVTLFATAVELLGKSLLVPPGEWYGLADVETRYRQRYVDLQANPDSLQRFVKRSAVVRDVRRFLEERGFLEVETPLLHAIAGGAAARPFVTHHNALDLDLFLRVAPELHLKRLLVGGFERVFEIGRNFRNEGLSPRHNPEFTMLEAYWAYARMDDWISALEELLAGLAVDHGTHRLDERDLAPHEIAWGGRVLDFSRPFARATWAELLAEHAGVDMFDEAAVRAAATRQRIDVQGRSHAKLLEDLFDAHVEQRLVDPTFVTDFPIELSPLSKARPDDRRVAERFELFVAGMEISNAFSELNDPEDQLARFEAQVASKDPELPAEVDHDYVAALRYGMPPAAGIGVGIDRLVMLLSGAETIRDVILFPLLRPREGEPAAGERPDAPRRAVGPAAGQQGEA